MAANVLAVELMLFGKVMFVFAHKDIITSQEFVNLAQEDNNGMGLLVFQFYTKQINLDNSNNNNINFNKDSNKYQSNKDNRIYLNNLINHNKYNKQQDLNLVHLV